MMHVHIFVIFVPSSLGFVLRHMSMLLCAVSFSMLMYTVSFFYVVVYGFIWLFNVFYVDVHITNTGPNISNPERSSNGQ